MNEEEKYNDIEAELKNKFGKPNPFLVPDNYFENLESNIVSNSKKNNSIKSPLIIQYYKPILSIAALLCIVLFIKYYFYSTHFVHDSLNEVQLRSELEKIPNAEIKSYLNNHVDEINEEVLFTNTNVNNINMYLNDNQELNSEYESIIEETSEADLTNLNI